MPIENGGSPLGPCDPDGGVRTDDREPVVCDKRPWHKPRVQMLYLAQTEGGLTNPNAGFRERPKPTQTINESIFVGRSTVSPS